MSLDDEKALKRFDPSGFLELMEATPSRMATPTDATKTYRTSFEPSSVVLGGVGGSGIAGDIVADYCRGVTRVPVSVCRTLHIPKAVGKSTLYLAISYSGETRETLGQLDQAAKSGAYLAAITSGGELLSRAKGRNIPYLQVPSNLPPRVALPELMSAVIFALDSGKVITNTQGLLSEAARSVKDLIEHVRAGIPSNGNPAKKCAQALLDKIPLLVGDEEYGSVLRRFKNQINENAKMPAFIYTMPEGFHNDVEGLETLAKLARVQPLILRTPEASEDEQRIHNQLARLMQEMGFPHPIEFEGLGSDRLSRLLTAITFGDFVSVYLAILRGVDPAQLTLIPKFRAIMSAS